MRSSGNTILITGGGTGMGRELAVTLHRAGNRVVIAGRRTEVLQRVAKSQPGIDYLTLDLSDDRNLRTFVDRLVDSYPALNVVVNNAGVSRPEDDLEANPADVRPVIDANLTGPIQLTSMLVPTLAANAPASIVNVSSALGFVPVAAMATYSATKAGLHSYTESLRLRLRDSGIEVLEVIPPRVDTGMPGGTPPDDDTMSVGDFASRTVAALIAPPLDGRIPVGAARTLHDAERNGRYDDVLATINRRESS